MKMFPHSFSIFHRVHEIDASVGRQTSKLVGTPDGPRALNSIKIDVERAIKILLDPRAVKDDHRRQECRLQLINNVPSYSIDWDTVNWVDMCPFQTARH